MARFGALWRGRAVEASCGKFGLGGATQGGLGRSGKARIVEARWRVGKMKQRAVFGPPLLFEGLEWNEYALHQDADGEPQRGRIPGRGQHNLVV